MRRAGRSGPSACSTIWSRRDQPGPAVALRPLPCNARRERSRRPVHARLQPTSTLVPWSPTRPPMRRAPGDEWRSAGGASPLVCLAHLGESRFCRRPSAPDRKADQRGQWLPAIRACAIRASRSPDVSAPAPTSASARRFQQCWRDTAPGANVGATPRREQSIARIERDTAQQRRRCRVLWAENDFRRDVAGRSRLQKQVGVRVCDGRFDSGHRLTPGQRCIGLVDRIRRSCRSAGNDRSRGPCQGHRVQVKRWLWCCVRRNEECRRQRRRDDGPNPKNHDGAPSHASVNMALVALGRGEGARREVEGEPLHGYVQFANRRTRGQPKVWRRQHWTGPEGTSRVSAAASCGPSSRAARRLRAAAPAVAGSSPAA